MKQIETISLAELEEMAENMFGELVKAVVDEGHIITTLEMRMKCGVGKCGRCNMGGHFICLDGPIFTLEEIGRMHSDV